MTERDRNRDRERQGERETDTQTHRDYTQTCLHSVFASTQVETDRTDTFHEDVGGWGTGGGGGVRTEQSNVNLKKQNVHRD